MQCDYTRVCKQSKIANNDGKMGQLWGIAFGKNGMWAVSDNTEHCVYIYLIGRLNLLGRLVAMVVVMVS